MNPEETKEAGSVNPLTGRTRTGGSYSSATRSAISANNVPMSSLTNTGPSLNMPTPTVPQVDTKGALGAAESVLKDFETQATAQRDASANVLSESDRRIREAVGIMGTQAQTRGEFEKKAGVDAFSQDLTKFQQRLRQQMADLDQMDVNNTNTIESMRVDASKRDITKRTFNAMSAEANIQMAVERANMVGQTRATIAAIDITQGNLQAATDQVDKALNAIYEPIKMGLEMEMFFNQRNFSMFSDAQKELSNVRMKGVEQQLREIDNARLNVDAAVASGFASSEDIQAMVGLSGNPVEQNKYAQNIIAKASRAEVQRQQAQMAASQSATSWSQRANAYELAMNGDPAAIEFLGFDPRKTNMTLQDSFNFINATAEDDRILMNLEKALSSEVAIQASAGVVQNALGTAAARYGGPGMIAGGGAGSVIPGVGTAIGSFGGFVAGTAMGYSHVANQKKDLLGSLSALSNTAAFSKMREYKEQGLTFGALTEAERIAIGKSAADLFAALDIENDGTVSGINVSEKRFVELVTSYQTDIQRKKEQKAIIYSGLTPADEALIDGL